ncbi:GNAT family N-acetyltransferase [Verrucomicrobiota bacterium]|nr:GNAT family N-acetyltransferase [Verrucomicrobiota bacterium]
MLPVNPQHRTILGVPCVPSLRDLPESIDLAVIATPAPTVPGLITECAQAGAKGVVIISAGFKETGPAGVALEQQILAHARAAGIRVIGPNCLGVMMPHHGLNATFAATTAHPGSVGFISQSGALCTAILDWSLQANVGFSAFISVGSMLDVGWGDLIFQLGDDPHTQSIVIYMESIGDASAFLSAAREVALTKPIIVIKAGRTAAAAQAAASHTGALTGSDDVLDAAFRRVGVLRVDTIEELFDMAEVLAQQPRPRGPRLAIITNAGGPGVLATDRLITSGGQLAPLAPETLAQLNQFLPPHWSHHNPIDILGDAGPDRYARTLEIVARDPNVDGLLVILTPQAMTDPTETARRLAPFAQLPGKPLLASWMGGAEVEAGRRLLSELRIPALPYPDTAACAFFDMFRLQENLRSLYETPMLAPESAETAANRATVEQLVRAARDAGRTLLTEVESHQILRAYGIPTVEARVALTADEAVQHAESIGYPVVLKLYSQTITHKSDVGGVHLNLPNAAAVQRAWQATERSVRERAGAGHFLGVTVEPMLLNDGCELILGSSHDAQFGPVLLFGAGGTLVEVMQDRALGPPPLTTTLARRLMEQTRIHRALLGTRGRPPVNLAALEQLLVHFSHLIVDHPWIKEIDINPLFASARRIVAVDARVVVHGRDVTAGQLVRPAIRPYPVQFISHITLKNGATATLRPIRPEDEPLLVRFHETLSARSVFQRYFTTLPLSARVSHERLARICFNDYDREIALVAEHTDPATGARAILGVGRLTKLHGVNAGEFGIVVSDPWQNQGLGTLLLDHLKRIARAEKLDRLSAVLLADNLAMQQLCRRRGFEILPGAHVSECRAEMKL